MLSLLKTITQEGTGELGKSYPIVNLLYPIEIPEANRNTDDEPPESGSQENCQSEDRTDRNRPQRQAAKRAVEQISRQLKSIVDDQDCYS